MCPSDITVLENAVKELYTLLGVQTRNAGVKFGEDLPAGFQITDESGQVFVHSPLEMASILDCAQRVFESWTDSGKQPAIQVLLSWFESMGVVQEERITTLLLVVTITALRLSIASGDSSTVSRMLQNISAAEELSSTAQSTSSKSKTTSGNGTSSEPRPHGKKGSSRGVSTPRGKKKTPPGSRNPDSPAGNSTLRKKLRDSDQK